MVDSTELAKMRQRTSDLEELMLSHSKLYRDAMQLATTYARREEAYRKILISLMRKMTQPGALIEVPNLSPSEKEVEEWIDAEVSHIMAENEQRANSL